MSNVLPFKKPSLKDKHKGKTLCKNGFHKWVVVSNSRGQLVTTFKCARCGEMKTELR